MNLEDELFKLSFIHPSRRVTPVILDYFGLHFNSDLKDYQITDLLKETYIYAEKHKPLERLDKDMQLRIYHIAPSLCELYESTTLSHKSGIVHEGLLPGHQPPQ